MKIEQKIVVSITFNLGLILLIGLFSLQDLNLVLTKLRFTAIADEFNASFLEMRLSEKNYFLYQDASALDEIHGNLERTMASIDSASTDIASAIGNENLRTLKIYVHGYAAVVEEVRAGRMRDSTARDLLRKEGRKLKDFSENVTRAERDRVKGIISSSKKVFFYSFGAVFLLALGVSHFISQKILRSLRAIETVAKAISAGNFDTVGGELPHDEMGTVLQAVNSMSEELKNREEALIQSKKLASIGILTAGVAHELTNPLNNISMIAQNYAEYYDQLSREQRIDLMSQVDGQAHRIEEIVRNLLDFSKPKEANLEVSEINETIRTALRLIQNTLDISNIEPRLALAERLPPVFIDRHQIEQVFLNLVVNATQAMAPGGTLTIATGFDAVDDLVRVEVRDTGRGIAPEHLPHIFDPFFSTKGVEGTGLGLSVSYGIIRNHRGSIKVKSTVGVGTTFVIELPRYHEPPRAEKAGG